MKRGLRDRPKLDAGTATTDMRALTQDLARYHRPIMGRSIVEILITAIALILLWLAMWRALDIGYGLYLLLAVPGAGFLVSRCWRQSRSGRSGLAPFC